MFYRTKFADWIEDIFERAGYDTDAALALWPEGRTLKWAERGRKAGLSPVEAAALSVADLILDKLKAGEMERADALFILKMAHLAALDEGASHKVLERLSLIAYDDKPEVADKARAVAKDCVRLSS